MALVASDCSSFVFFKFNLVHMKCHGFNDFLHIGSKISVVQNTGLIERIELCKIISTFTGIISNHTVT